MKIDYERLSKVMAGDLDDQKAAGHTFAGCFKLAVLSMSVESINVLVPDYHHVVRLIQEITGICINLRISVNRIDPYHYRLGDCHIYFHNPENYRKLRGGMRQGVTFYLS